MRRRLLLALLVAGLGAQVAGPALSSRPYVPPAVEFSRPVAAPPGEPWRSPVIETAKRFDLVGLTWRATSGPVRKFCAEFPDARPWLTVDGVPPACWWHPGGRQRPSGADRAPGKRAELADGPTSRRVDARIRVRDAADGSWSPWSPLADDHAGGAGAEPVWAGGADALQLRFAHAPRGLRAQFVNSTGTATRAARLLTAARRVTQRAFVALAGEPARAQALDGAPTIITRAEWGAAACGQPRFHAQYGTVEAAFVHHTVNANDYGPQDSAAIVRAICRYHRDTKGWRDIGYNFLVDRYGQIFEGREGGIDQAVIGAQAQGYNGVSTGVANIGTFSGVAQTQAAVQAMAELLAWKLTLHGVPVEGQVTVLSGGGPSNRFSAGTPVTFERISGHRDADATSCPGNALYAQLPQLRGLAAEIAPELPPPEATAPGATVTLAAADTTLDYPQPAQLAGRVAQATGAPLAGATVSIQIASGTGFTTLSRVLTRDDGTWSAQVPTQYSRTLRAALRLADGTLAASTPIAVAVAPRIGVVAPRRVTALRTFTVTGSVRPLRGGVTLVVARQGTDRAFHTVARAPVRVTQGSFVVRVRLRRPALHRLRIESRQDTRNGPGRSRDVILRAISPRR